MLSEPAPKQQSPLKPQFLIKMKTGNKKHIRLNSIIPSSRYKPSMSNPGDQYSQSTNFAKCKTESIDRSFQNEDQMCSVRLPTDVLDGNSYNGYKNLVLDESIEDSNMNKIRIKKQLRMKKLDYIQKNIFSKIQSESSNPQPQAQSIKLQNYNINLNLLSNGHSQGQNSYSNIIYSSKREKNVENQFLPPIESSRVRIKENQGRNSHTPKMVQCADGMITFSPKKNRNLANRGQGTSSNTNIEKHGTNCITLSPIPLNKNQFIF